MQRVKVLRRILAWIFISLMLQCCVLLYANNFVFSAKTTFKATKVNDNKKSKDVTITIPENAGHVNVSYNAKYLAYYEGDILYVINTKTGDKKEVEFDKDVKVSFYKWLPDRNRMLIAEKTMTKYGSSGFKLSYYDVDKDSKEQIKELTWADSKSEVEDIQVSTLTNVIYVKVSHAGQRSSIYCIYIMKDMKKVETRSYVIGKIATIPHSENMVYEDLTYHKIRVTNKYNSISIKNAGRLCLISVDSDDKIYLGEIDGNNNVTKIYSGTVDEDTSEWNVTKLNQSASRDDIFISSQGKIFVNNGLKGVVHDITTGKETTYTGKLIQMYDDGIISVSENKLVNTTFK